MAAAGIFGMPSRYCSAPVCGVERLWPVIDRTSTATAPNSAARDAPELRYTTVWPYPCQVGLNNTILPATLARPSAVSSSKVFTVMTSAEMPSAGVPTLIPNPSSASGF